MHMEYDWSEFETDCWAKYSLFCLAISEYVFREIFQRTKETARNNAQAQQFGFELRTSTNRIVDFDFSSIRQYDWSKSETELHKYFA